MSCCTEYNGQQLIVWMLCCIVWEHYLLFYSYCSLLLADTSQPLNRESISHTCNIGARGGWLSSGGIESGLKPSPSPLALKLRLAHTHLRAWVSVCLCGRGVHWKVKNQPTSSLRRRRERTEESWVLVWVGNCINTINRMTVCLHCLQTYTFAIHMYIMSVCLYLIWKVPWEKSVVIWRYIHIIDLTCLDKLIEKN